MRLCQKRWKSSQQGSGGTAEPWLPPWLPSCKSPVSLVSHFILDRRVLVHCATPARVPALGERQVTGVAVGGGSRVLGQHVAGFRALGCIWKSRPERGGI